jgi:ZIP family zinc transporter
VGTRTLGMVMAFGSGVLISGVAYELALEAFETADGSRYATAGLFAGSLVSFASDTLIDRLGDLDRKRSHGGQTRAARLRRSSGGRGYAATLKPMCPVVLSGVLRLRAATR